jgi:3-deoxy-7-phosphoheptulonate synthase
MIARLSKTTTETKAIELADKYKAILLSEFGSFLLITSSAIKTIEGDLKDAATEVIITHSDIQLASKQFQHETRTVKIGGTTLGGGSKSTIVITGPCSVETEEQIEKCAELCVELDVKVLRAGAYKPRTSPYTFQGLGLEGLKLLDKMRSKYGLQIITEIRDSTHADEVIEYADIIQIGAKSMYDHGILRKCGKSKKPVLLKRGFGTTLQEFVQGAEFILCGGNPNVILCERGIRTFETKTRFTLDLCGVAWLKEHANLPIIVDPSHAIGYAYGVSDLTRAAAAMGVDGLIIETHPTPKVALSDADQQLNFEEFRALHKSLESVLKAVGRSLT